MVFICTYWGFWPQKAGGRLEEEYQSSSKLLASFPSLESKLKCIISSFLFASKADEEEVGNCTIQLPNNSKNSNSAWHTSQGTTENVHLHPSHNALSYDLIPRWAFSFFLILFYLVFVLWLKNKKKMRKQILNLTLGGRTGTVTVSPLSTVLVLWEEWFSPALPQGWWGDNFPLPSHVSWHLWAKTCPHGKERTKSGAVVLSNPPLWWWSLPSCQGYPSSFMGNATSQSRSQSLLQHPS